MSSEYYAIQWFLTLFASDLPQPIVRRIWDRFLVAGWRVMAQVGLVLLYRIQDALLEMDLILVFSQSQEKNIEVQGNNPVFFFYHYLIFVQHVTVINAIQSFLQM